MKAPSKKNESKEYECEPETSEVKPKTEKD